MPDQQVQPKRSHRVISSLHNCEVNWEWTPDGNDPTGAGRVKITYPGTDVKIWFSEESFDKAHSRVRLMVNTNQQCLFDRISPL